MSMPPYVSLKNKANNEYRNNHATKMQSDYESPACLFNLVDQGNGTYGIKNVKNDEYFDCSITSMSGSIEGDCQLWQFMSIPTVENGYYIQNIENRQYMTKKASQLSKNAGNDEIYIVEARDN
jgi:hypothetical protein